jgi:hypothetical protein
MPSGCSSERPSASCRRAPRASHWPTRRARRASVGMTTPSRSPLAHTQGYPCFLQELGRWTWREGDGERIGRADVEAAIPLAEAELDESFFEVRLGRLNATQRAYILAMAELGVGPRLSGQLGANDLL